MSSKFRNSHRKYKISKGATVQNSIPQSPQSEFGEEAYASDDFEIEETSILSNSGKNIYILGKNIEDQLQLTNLFHDNNNPGNDEGVVEEDDWISVNEDVNEDPDDDIHSPNSRQKGEPLESEGEVEYYDENFDIASPTNNSPLKSPRTASEDTVHDFPIGPFASSLITENNNLTEFSSLTFTTAQIGDDKGIAMNNVPMKARVHQVNNNQVEKNDQNSHISQASKPKVHWQAEGNPPKRRQSAPGQRVIRSTNDIKTSPVQKASQPSQHQQPSDNKFNNNNNNNIKKPQSTSGLAPRPPSNNAGKNIPNVNHPPTAPTVPMPVQYAASDMGHVKFQKVSMPEINKNFNALAAKVAVANIITQQGVSVGELQKQLKIADKKLSLTQLQNQQLLEKLDSLSSVESLISNYQYELKQKQAKIQELIKENHSLHSIARYQGKALVEQQDIKDNDVDHNISQERYIDVLAEHIKKVKEKNHEQKQVIRDQEKKIEELTELVEEYKKKVAKKKAKKVKSTEDNATPRPSKDIALEPQVPIIPESETIEKLQRQKELADKLHNQEVQNLKKQNALLKTKMDELQQELSKRELVSKNQIIQLKSLKQKYEDLFASHQQLIAGSALFQSDTKKNPPPAAMIIHPTPPPVQPSKVKQAVLADNEGNDFSPAKQSFFITTGQD